MPIPIEILKKYWGYDHFRLSQQEIIQSVLEKQNTVALLPTGGGKSLCYQLPAIALEGICIVVSPLISLMKDQVQGLKRKGLIAEGIWSGIAYRDIKRILDNALTGKVKYLYLSPERIQSSFFQEYFTQLNVSFITIDEAHCISQWGYDFRPSYLLIKKLKELKPDLPILALTATASPQVLADIKVHLEIENARIFKNSFFRNNISLVFRNTNDKRQQMLNVLQNVPGPAVIYMRSRSKTVEIAKFLSEKGFEAVYYHAGLDSKQRDSVQDIWMKDKKRIIVATTAFGMGIDKSNVRSVIHLDLPPSPEELYQEYGRAGRDGKRAYAAIFYNDADLNNLQNLAEESYPDQTEVIQVYHQLAIDSQTGTGEQSVTYFNFDIAACCRATRLHPAKVMNAINLLELNGFLLTTSAVQSPDRLLVMANRAELNEFYPAYPDYEPLVTLLLRTYGGITNVAERINLFEIASKLRKNESDVKADLIFLHRLEIVDYQPAADRPQISFGNYRFPAEELRPDMTSIEFLKARMKERNEAVLNIITGERCRNIAILAYFGEQLALPCGICDICLQKEKLPLDPQLNEIIIFLNDKLKQGNIPVAQLKSSGFYLKNKKGIELALQFMLDEKLIYFANDEFSLNDKK